MGKVIVTDQRYAPMFLKWMKERIGGPGNYEPDDCRTLAHVQFNEDGTIEILCVVAYDRWTPFTCEAHIASDGTKRWCTRNFVFAFYHLAFNEFGKTRMNFTVAPDNIAALRMHEKLGHKLECRLADVFGEGEDAFLYGITKQQWQEGRWNQPKHDK